MIKKAFFLSLVCSFSFASEMVNAVAAIVENEPITVYEIQKVKEQLKVDNKRAFELLIRDRLEQTQIKNLGINVSLYEINERIDQIAKENKTTVSKLRDNLEFKKGVKFRTFRDDVEKSLLQEKLYKVIFDDARKNVTEDRARAYYEANKDKFRTFKNASVTIFTSEEPSSLLEQLENDPNKPLNGVKSQRLELSYDKINPNLADLIASTPEKGHTNPLRRQGGYDIFYVHSKSGSYVPGFEDVKNKAMSHLYQFEQKKAAKEYFDKLRVKTKIRIIREP